MADQQQNKHTQIGTRVKIHQCVLMDNVTVQDGVTLQNTVVSPHAIVQVCVVCAPDCLTAWLIGWLVGGFMLFVRLGLSSVVRLFVLLKHPAQEFCSLTDVFVGSYMTVPPKTKQKGGELMRD